MVYLNPSQFKPCITLENNFQIILKDYQNFLFDFNNLNDLDSQDEGAELWEKGHEVTYDNTNVDDYTDPYETYQKAPGWYGVKSSTDKRSRYWNTRTNRKRKGRERTKRCKS